ncbi:MAG: hypothetical protein QOG91_260, partial [Candidatus Parcubacteria bacterium]|nr:hypothetical protein [Candidatus Parcubacteria bacterium]
MNELTFARINKTIAWSLAACLAAYLVIANTLPFGASARYESALGSISPLGPAERVEQATDGETAVVKQKDDLIYFS